MAHMRQDVDRCVSDEIDVVGTASERAFNIAGIERIEKIQHALAVKLIDHFLFPPVPRPARIAASMAEEIAQRSIGKTNHAV
jgi:hypothetical protein